MTEPVAWPWVVGTKGGHGLVQSRGGRIPRARDVLNVGVRGGAHEVTPSPVLTTWQMVTPPCRVILGGTSPLPWLTGQRGETAGSLQGRSDDAGTARTGGAAGVQETVWQKCAKQGSV